MRELSFGPEGKTALKSSLKAALRLGHNYIGTEHVLLGALFARVFGLGAKLARRYPDRMTLDFFGDRLVCHLSDRVPDTAVAYPHHFGVSFAKSEDFDRLVRAVSAGKTVPSGKIVLPAGRNGQSLW